MSGVLEPAHELGPEVIVPALSLDGLDDDACHRVRMLLSVSSNGFDGAVLGGLEAFLLGIVDRERDLRVRETRPSEFDEIPGLVGVGVRRGQGVSAAAVEGFTEVSDADLGGLAKV